MNSTMRRNTSLCLLFVLLTTGALAQQPQAARADAPSVERLRVHVEYLAADRLEGRRTGTQGAMQAAEYVAAEFKRLGLKPAAPPRSTRSDGQQSAYLQPFPYV